METAFNKKTVKYSKVLLTKLAKIEQGINDTATVQDVEAIVAKLHKRGVLDQFGLFRYLPQDEEYTKLATWYVQKYC